MPKPNKRIGILGGGQLALMLAESYVDSDVTFLSADQEGSCAFAIAKSFTNDLSIKRNLDEFSQLSDVVTFDSEHLGVEFAADILSNGINVYPDYKFVRLSGDRFEEKSELNRLGIKTAPFIKIDEKLDRNAIHKVLTDLLETQELSEFGIVIKTRHGGYDGKGQWVLKDGSDTSKLHAISNELSELVREPGLIIEGLVNFDFECSIIATRSIKGDIVTWPLIHNIHKDSILDISRSPINNELISESDEKTAKEYVSQICEEHNYVGTICVELFHTKSGLIVNEIAPRVHNSGHLTIEGSKTSQFRNHINAIRGENLESTELIGHCAMINIVGFKISEKTQSLIDSIEGIYFHWYNKDVRPKRKVGHITIVSNTDLELEDTIRQIRESIEAESI